MFWSPTANSLEEWSPQQGWSSTFSQEDKIICTNLFFFFKRKGYDEKTAESLSQMEVYKRKYELSYSREQEDLLREALKYQGSA